MTAVEIDGSWVEIAQNVDLAPETAQQINVQHGGKTYVLALVRDSDKQYHVIDDNCPHGDVSLAEGDVEGCQIECWGHGASVNLETGVGTLPITSPVQVYPVKQIEKNIYIQFPSV